MELCIGLLILAGTAYGLYQLGRFAAGRTVAAHAGSDAAARARRAQARIIHQRRLQVAHLRQRQNALARDLQLALIRIEQAPDFRRAASFAARAKDVPVAFRQRQFRRFKPRLLAHMAARLTAGADPEQLTESLAALVQALGVAPFEADYIRTEAERHLTPPRRPATPPYAQQIAQLQRDHEQRLAALQGLTGLDGETRDRLLELEQTRFQEALEGLGTDHPARPNP